MPRVSFEYDPFTNTESASCRECEEKLVEFAPGLYRCPTEDCDNDAPITKDEIESARDEAAQRAYEQLYRPDRGGESSAYVAAMRESGRGR